MPFLVRDAKPVIVLPTASPPSPGVRAADMSRIRRRRSGNGTTLCVRQRLFLFSLLCDNGEDMKKKQHRVPWWKKSLRILGPGIITGAADDDPAGIVTYTIAGAQGGFAFLWTAVLTFPFMVAIQEMCARIGMVTGHGLAGVMKRQYSRPLLWLVMVLVVFANTVNIGADLGGMAEAVALLIPLPPLLLGAVLAGGMISLMIFLPYRLIAKTLKWLTLALFAYIFAAVAARPDWGAVVRATFLPTIAWNRETLMVLVAVLGTTISPYLFFWQASEEVEERNGANTFRVQHHIVTKTELVHMRADVGVGMLFSNIVMYFIMVNAGAVFHAHGITELTSAGQVASALAPLAGPLATLLFVIGVLGTGLLAIPVLAGSTAYVVAETFGVEEGLNKRFSQAKVFYIVMALATFFGFLLNISGIPPLQALFASAVLSGILSPPLIAVILDIANRKSIMGNKTNTLLQNILGGVTLVCMTVAAGALLWSLAWGN